MMVDLRESKVRVVDFVAIEVIETGWDHFHCRLGIGRTGFGENVGQAWRG